MGVAGGGGDSTPQAAATTAVTVAPALGIFSRGTRVTIKKPNGERLGEEVEIPDATGKAVVNILPSYSGPILIEVRGGPGVTYFDENAVGTPNALRPFGANDVLRAIAPAVQTAIGVTAATNAAVAVIEAANSGTIPAGITFDTIKRANAKIEAALGIADVLQAPRLVGADTPRTLNIANVEDRYAFQLAALAKLAIPGKTALDVAKDLAKDMADGNLDGKVGTLTIPGVAYAASSIVADMQTKIGGAVAQFGDADSKTIVTNNPTVLGKITPDVTAIAAPAGTNLSDLQKAKAMFAELRTTLKSFSNGSTGFLDTQAERMNADLNANVTPELSKVADRISTLNKAMSFFEDGKAYTIGNTFGLVTGTAPDTGNVALVRKNGSLQAVWDGYGSYDFCWTDAAATVTSKVSCAYAGADSADRPNRIKFVTYVLTRTATTATTNQYSYTATRYNRAVSLPGGVVTLGATTQPNVPTGSGTLTKTVDGSTTTGLTINGTLTPSALSPTNTLITGVDRIAISAARTALAATGNFRYALTGSVSTSKLTSLGAEDPAKVVTLSLDSGSFIDLDEGTATTEGAGPLAITLIGTAQTAETKFTGTLTAGTFKSDLSGQDYSPTSVVFNGSISDTSIGGAGEILTGKLEAGITNYASYDGRQPTSPSNFVQATITFTGTVQAPSRPLLKLVLSGRNTDPDSGTITLNYSYGTVSITGTGTTGPTGSTMTLSNQDGIQLTPDATDKSIIRVTKAGGLLASIQNGSVRYVDGITESLN